MLLNYTEKEIHEIEIELPASKSISNRALIIQALSSETIELSNLSEAKDTQILLNALRQKSLKKNVELAGTAARFLTAYLATQKANYILDGAPRMRERAIKPLVDALCSLGAEINYLEKEGFLPIQFGETVLKGGQVEIEGNISSQFISALMMIAPTLNNGLTIIPTSSLTSQPYVNMTYEIMNRFGAQLNISPNKIQIESGRYKGGELKIESDWSAASYFYSIVALSDECSIILKDLNFDSWQGDAEIAEIFYRLGVLSTKLGDDILLEKSDNVINYMEYDFSDCPDLAQTVICTCAGLGIEGKFSGLHTLKGKETDRILALQNELAKLNWSLIENQDSSVELMRSKTPKSINLKIETYKDHRMAMAFAPLAIIFGNIEIEKPEVVEKSFPNFWLELRKLGLE